MTTTLVFEVNTAIEAIPFLQNRSLLQHKIFMMDVELLLGLVHSINGPRTHPLDCLNEKTPVVDALAEILDQTAGEVVAFGVQLSQKKKL